MAKQLSVAQVLNLFFVMVTHVVHRNKTDENKYPQLDLTDLINLRKELELMASDNDYMNDHFWKTPKTLLKQINTSSSFLHRDCTIWLEEFISEYIFSKHRTKYLTEEGWTRIYNFLDSTYVKVKKNFREGEISYHLE